MSFRNFFKKRTPKDRSPVIPESEASVSGQPDPAPDTGAPDAESALDTKDREPGSGSLDPQTSEPANTDLNRPEPDPGNGPPSEHPSAPVHPVSGPEEDTGLEKVDALPTNVEDVPAVSDTPPRPLIKKVYFLGGGHEKLNQRLKDELKRMGFSWIDLSSAYMETALDEVMMKNPDVFFCVAALSGDEFFYDKNSKPANARLCSKQDIVFKLGYMIGHHGKSNCFVLYKEQKSFALPTSLIHGIFTVVDDDVRWRDMLKSRLIGGGYTIS